MEPTSYLSDKLKEALREAEEFITQKFSFNKPAEKQTEIDERLSLFEFFEEENPIRISIIWDKLKEKWLHRLDSGYKEGNIEGAIVQGTFQEESSLFQKDELYLYFENKVIKAYQIFTYGERLDFEEKYRCPC